MVYRCFLCYHISNIFYERHRFGPRKLPSIKALFMDVSSLQSGEKILNICSDIFSKMLVQSRPRWSSFRASNLIFSISWAFVECSAWCIWQLVMENVFMVLVFSPLRMHSYILYEEHYVGEEDPLQI